MYRNIFPSASHIVDVTWSSSAHHSGHFNCLVLCCKWMLADAVMKYLSQPKNAAPN